jgi:hypothetical protein
MCLRFVFLLITRVAAWLRLSRREERWKAAEILSLRHQLAILQRRQPRRLKPRPAKATGDLPASSPARWALRPASRKTPAKQRSPDSTVGGRPGAASPAGGSPPDTQTPNCVNGAPCSAGQDAARTTPRHTARSPAWSLTAPPNEPPATGPPPNSCPPSPQTAEPSDPHHASMPRPQSRGRSSGPRRAAPSPVLGGHSTAAASHWPSLHHRASQVAAGT